MPQKFTKPQVVAVSQFKAHCLELVELAHAEGRQYVITKHGKPVARLTPIGGNRLRSPRGCWKDLMRIQADIVQVDWSAEFEATS